MIVETQHIISNLFILFYLLKIHASILYVSLHIHTDSQASCITHNSNITNIGHYYQL